MSSLLLGGLLPGLDALPERVLGYALILASNLKTMYQGMGLLLTFSLGLGVPFLIAASFGAGSKTLSV